MSTDPTIPQVGSERRVSQEMSLKPGQPPLQVPGYETERLLGVGAYGEVWVAVEKNTGRRVAIKFYAHRGGLDWSLLSREVEKLAFLFADRYVVQLIGVGWEAEPPYYVMEYLEQGSLAERLQSGTIPVAQAVELFRDVATGLAHAHGKGVLHCDLKPGNVLLDQDGKPRLADFGQSRLSHEQVPALGTLFYMAPEQADLAAVPDARWDVYALGALLYCMLTGSPPHRTEKDVRQLEQTADLRQRLSIYRRMIRRSGRPTAHRRVAGVDRALADIIDRCLAYDPEKRFPNVQSVLAALDARAAQRARRPVMVLGFLGPALLLAVVSLFAYSGFNTAVGRTDEALTRRALDNNLLMARYVAGLASKELNRRYEAVEQVAGSEELRQAIEQTVAQPELAALLAELSDPNRSEEELEPLREKFRDHPLRKALQAKFDALLPTWMRPPEKEGEPEDVASWFYCDPRGVSTARVPESTTLAKNYAWRSFFHGGPSDYKDRRARPAQHLTRPQLSAVFRSEANGFWIVAVAAPVFDRPGGKFLGVVALTVRVTRFVELQGTPEQFAVLVELRPGDYTGVILQHPLFDQLLAQRRDMPIEFQEDKYRLTPGRLPGPIPPEGSPPPDTAVKYQDPLAASPLGEPYRRDWLAQMEKITLRNRHSGRAEDVGWAVIVQEDYRSAIGSTLAKLRFGLIAWGIVALVMVVVVVFGLWGLAVRMFKEASPVRLPGPLGPPTERPTGSVTPDSPTVSQRTGRRKEEE